MPQDDRSQNQQNQQLDPNQGYISSPTPEAPMVAPTNAEASKTQEGGYEQIKQIEQQAQKIEKREGQLERTPQKPTPQKPQAKTVEKKEPQVEKPKVFGYNPPPQLINNPSLVKKNVGKGNSHDSKTWLIMLLDRIFKQQNS